jgi:hypothetical protein
VLDYELHAKRVDPLCDATLGVLRSTVTAGRYQVGSVGESIMGAIRWQCRIRSTTPGDAPPSPFRYPVQQPSIRRSAGGPRSRYPFTCCRTVGYAAGVAVRVIASTQA